MMQSFYEMHEAFRQHKLDLDIFERSLKKVLTKSDSQNILTVIKKGQCYTDQGHKRMKY